MFEINSIVFGLIGGIIPSLVWLWFWLKEDEHPEPRKMIVLAFLAGMLAVPLAVPLQLGLKHFLVSPTALTFGWAFIEEFLKFVLAYLFVLNKKADDEPVDPMIYMLTAALGFAALENAFFMFGPLHQGDMIYSLLTGNLRFIGATLLHVVCSTSIGVAIGLAFYKSKAERISNALIGLGIATGLHSLFNLFIISSNGVKVFSVFYAVWLAIVVMALFFEKVKRVKQESKRIEAF